MALAWYGWPTGLLLSYPVRKLLHLSGVVMFMGNLIAGPVWLAFAYFGGDRKLMVFATRTLAQADIWLTAPGVQLTVWNGICLAPMYGGARAQPWLAESLGLLVLAAILTLATVLPWQERLVRAAEAQDEAGLKRALTQWAVWGTLIMIPFSLAAWLMIAKKALF
ncbi:MAG: DUF2269 family protein [Candidatus Schekmanbacteria bacterium]|nr:DUF2269 family protein [Candidatus Schekmanbacteria bacterium]